MFVTIRHRATQNVIKVPIERIRMISNVSMYILIQKQTSTTRITRINNKTYLLFINK